MTRTTRAIVLYALASLAVMGLAAMVLQAVYAGAGERKAVWITLVVALAVQVGSFVVARQLANRGLGIAGWGLGAAVCLVALVLYGLASRVLGLPQTPALMSLATYFTLSELIEGPFLFL